MCCESIPLQINYLIDEAVDVGKGANTVVSMLHHFFETHGLGEQHVHLHADNCVGQNTNDTMIHVSLSIRVFTDTFTSFLILVSSVEVYGGTSQDHPAIIYARRAYKLFPRLGLWALQKEVPDD